MTFILSEINHEGILMASDSSETRKDTKTGVETFHKAIKTLYFSALNIGISTWGDANVGTEGINDKSFPILD